MWLHPLCVTQQYGPASVASWLSSKGIPCHDLLPYVPLGMSTAVLTLLSNLYAPATECFRGLESLAGVCRAEARIVWFSLHSKCHRSAASLSDSVRCFPSVPNNFPDVHILPLLQFHQPPGIGPVPLILSFSSFLHPTKFCMDLYIPFWWSGTPASCQLVFCEIFCI